MNLDQRRINCRSRTARLFVILCLASGCTEPTHSGGTPSATLPESENTTPAPASPDVELQVLNYAQLMELVASKRGRIVVLDCWSTWCPPCIREFPNLVALDARYDDTDVACISASLDFDGLGDPEDRRPQVLEFLTKQGAAFDNVLCAEDDVTMYEKLGVNGVPVVFVYGPDGKLAKRFGDAEGEFTYEDVERYVQTLLAESDT